jgi:hypothetical protein
VCQIPSPSVPLGFFLCKRRTGLPHTVDLQPVRSFANHMRLSIVDLQYYHADQVPMLPPPIPALSTLSTTGLSLPGHPVATSINSPLPHDITPTSRAAPAPTDPDCGIFVVVTQEELVAPSSTTQEQSPSSAPNTDLSGSVPTHVSSEVEQMKAIKTKATIGLLSTLIGYVSLNSLYKSLNPEAFIWCEEDRDEAKWIATSKSWLDRKACRWLGICGAAHFQLARPKFGRHMKPRTQQPLDGSTTDWDWQNAWSEGKDRPQDWTDDERLLREIPDYVIEYAPLVHLFSGEQFWPCDLAEHLYHITPTLNYTPLPLQWQNPTLHNLNGLNDFERGKHIFLTSKDNVEELPDWLEGEKNIPDPPPEDKPWEDLYGTRSGGRTSSDRLEDGDPTEEEWNKDILDSSHNSVSVGASSSDKGFLASDNDASIPTDLRRRRRRVQRKNIRGGRSGAPAVLIVVDKGHGVVDAFWFFFYSFNLGNVVFNIRFGNHVGDWEHTVIRFHRGVPKAVYFSEHNFGSAYSYDAVEKLGKRPVIYSATGTHAMYATPGLHSYILPWGLLHDETDRGPLWDPALNVHTYTYDHLNDALRSSRLTPKAPTEWFHFNGHWGDKFYPLGDSRQYRFAGQYHYVNGPLGPKFKSLDRTHICPDEAAPCKIKNWLGGSSRILRGRGPGQGDMMSAEDERRFLGNDASSSDDV